MEVRYRAIGASAAKVHHTSLPTPTHLPNGGAEVIIATYEGTATVTLSRLEKVELIRLLSESR